MSTDGAHDSVQFSGTIHVMPYTHADIAWVHTRAWHLDRYTRVMDEVLALYDADPDYHYYVDTWIELMKPYIELRPRQIDAIRRRVSEGRLAVCGGQYGNVRSTAIGNETQIRNMQLGMRRWQELAPGVRFRVHSNIDVTFGHTQMPQLLGLAGIEAYFVMRPIAALDADGIPRAFRWRGLSGDTILVCRDSGVGLFQEHERFGPTWDGDWPAVVAHLWSTYLGQPARDGVSDIGLTVGVDDSRPERFAFSDAPANYHALIRAWNAREASTMRYGTPDTLVEALQAEEEHLQVVDAVLDPTCVSYNIALHGRRGIWWLREQADRLLVQAEIMGSLARASKGTPYPEHDLTAMWEQLLAWTPHAVQWLFREDWQAGELALMNVADKARAQIRTAAAALTGECLPMDARAIAVVNSLPRAETVVTPVWVINGDLTRGLAGFTDELGKPVPMQVVGFPVPGSELDVLVEANVPACGHAELSLVWEPAPVGVTYEGAIEHWRKRYGMVEPRTPDDEPLTLASDCVRMTLAGGQVVEVEDLASATPRRAPAGASFLEPVCYAIQRTGWSSDSIPDEPQGFAAEKVRLDEAGPLRWRVTRTGRTGGFWVRQHIDLLKGERAVRSTLQFLDPADEQDALIGLSVPIADGAVLSADIPFGIEPRAVESIRYGISERSIPGLFWGRTWADAQDEAGRIALVAADGDKLFRAYGSPRRLVHFMAQKTRVFEESWEAHIDTHDVGGRQIFHHILAVAGAGETRVGVVHLAERIRHPFATAYVPRSEPASGSRSLMTVAPETVCLSAMTWEGDACLVRVVQMANEPVEATIEAPFAVGAAVLVDFRGRPLPGEAAIEGARVRFALSGWQIATLRLTPGAGDSR